VNRRAAALLALLTACVAHQAPAGIIYLGPFPDLETSVGGDAGAAVGIVTSCEGKPLEGAMIDETSKAFLPTSTRANGFAIHPVPVRQYLLRVRAIGFQVETLAWHPRKGRVDTLQAALASAACGLCECIARDGRPVTPCNCCPTRCKQPAIR